MLEVMVALLIVGVVTTLSAGKFHAIIVQARVARAASSLRSDLEAAFTIAARNRQPTRISWNSTALQLDVTNRAGKYFRRTPLGKDYGLSTSNVTVTPSASPLEVYPTGLSNGTLTIVVSMEKTKRTIQMSRGGMVQVLAQ